MHALEGLLIVVTIVGFFYMAHMTLKDWLNFGVVLFVLFVGLRVITSTARPASISPGLSQNMGLYTAL